MSGNVHPGQHVLDDQEAPSPRPSPPGEGEAKDLTLALSSKERGQEGGPHLSPRFRTQCTSYTQCAPCTPMHVLCPRRTLHDTGNLWPVVERVTLGE